MDFEYTIRSHKRARNITVRVSQTGTVTVTKPPLVPQLIAEKFLEQKKEWVIKKLQQIQPKNNDIAYIFGKEYQKKVLYDSTKKIGISVAGDSVVFNATKPTAQWDTTAQRWLDRYIKQAATHYISQQTHRIAENMKVEYKNIRFKQQVSRWGSCSSKGNLNFNWRLAHFPPQIIDYVIVHELAHLTHMNHSTAFWALVGKWDKNYRQHRNWLKKYAHQYAAV